MTDLTRLTTPDLTPTQTTAIEKYVRSVTTAIDGKLRTPYHYGAGGGYTTVTAAYAGIDDTAAILALLAAWKDDPSIVPDFLGLYWTVSSEITIQQTAGFAVMQNPATMIGGTFVPKTGTSGTRIVTVNAPGAHIMGHLGAIGPGSTNGNCVTYASRSWDYGIHIVDSQTLRIDSWAASNVKCWGMDTATEDFANLGTRTNTNGSNIGLRIGPGNCYNCGSAGGQVNTSRLQYTFDSITYNGTSLNLAQTSTCHATAALDAKIASGDVFTYTHTDGTRQAYTVKTVDLVANTVEFYFWLPLGTYSGTVATSWTMDSSHGGALHVHGNNVGMSHFGKIEGIRCGQAFKSSALYGVSIDGVHFEASGINIVTGSPPNNPTIGGTIGENHCESTFLQWFHRSINSAGYQVDVASAFGYSSGTSVSQIYHGRPRNTSGVTQTQIGTGNLIYNDSYGIVSNENGPALYGAPANFTISNRPDQRHIRVAYASAATPTLTIDWDTYYADLWTGKHWMQAELCGIGARGEMTGALTIQLTAALISAGYTLNGSTSAITVNPPNGPIVIRVIRDLNSLNFKLFYEVIEPPTLQGTTVNGDAAATLNAATSTKVQIWNTALTANRAVTLQTTNVRDNDYFIITRTAAASGASTLNVGTGPLISLAAGQWCRVRYSSTLAAWYLEAS